jgi:hypothetical protein
MLNFQMPAQVKRSPAHSTFCMIPVPCIGPFSNLSSHMNAVDKDSNGDYVVSGRHTGTIYKVAGLNNPSYTPGEIIWQLGGKNNTFAGSMFSTVPNAPNLNFTWQHHVRYEPSINGISLWDNANNNVNTPSALASSGMSIAISVSSDNQTHNATLVGQYISPGRQLDSSQGSHQILANGNHFLGEGSNPFIYEQTSAGDTAYYASFGVGTISSYRSFKFPWTGNPVPSQMALLSYAQSCNASNTAFYASWNGATQVATWKFFAASSKSAKQFQVVATQAAAGVFETKASAEGLSGAVYAQALDANGKVLGTTATVDTFVPSPALAVSCGKDACPWGTDYKTAARAVC